MSKIYIALGSNLDEPSEQIYKAINSIDAIDDLSVTHISSLYKTVWQLKHFSQTPSGITFLSLLESILILEGMSFSNQLMTYFQQLNHHQVLNVLVS